MKICSGLGSDLRKKAYFCIKNCPPPHFRDLYTKGFTRISGQKYKTS